MKLDTFINRPVLSTVISIFIVLLGLIGLMALPVQQYPDIAPPTVSVTTTYTGANAQAVLNSVIAPLEESINGAQDMTYMTSTATNTGSATINVYFKQGRDADMAAVDVQNRVAKAQGLLPAEVTRVGVITQKRQTSMLVSVCLYVEEEGTYTEEFIENYLKINVVPALQRVSGVGDVMVMGADYSMRIWLKPDVMAQYGLMPTDVAAALSEQNIEAAPGAFGEQGDQTFQYTMKYKGRLVTPEEFENIVVRATSDGEILYLKDVANVELGRVTYGFHSTMNGKTAVNCMIFQTPGSNATQTINDVLAYVDQAKKDLPKGLAFTIPMNVNRFLNASIDKVLHTLVEAFILVFIVVYIFLQDFRSTIIPAIAIPVALIGTFFVMYLIGFTINLITLSAIVLAIAIVVDDAIVVVEAVHAKLDAGYHSARRASIDAMNEIASALISITLVMMLVFIPVSFMPGTSGTFYNQFGITMAIAIFFSAVNALTLSPALCAVFLKAHDSDASLKERLSESYSAAGQAIKKRYKKSLSVPMPPLLTAVFVIAAVLFMILGWYSTENILKLIIASICAVLALLGIFNDRFHEGFETGYRRVLKIYRKLVEFFIGHKILSGVIVAASIAILVFLMRITPTGMVPNEDTGTIFAVVDMPPGTSQERTGQVLAQVDSICAMIPAIETRTMINGYSFVAGQGSTYGTFILNLRDWSERGKGESSDDILKQLYGLSAMRIKDGRVMFFAPPMITGFSVTNGFSIEMQDKTGGDVNEFFAVVQGFLAQLNAQPEIQMAYTTFNPTFPQYMVDVDVAKAKQAGISPSTILTTLQGYYGGMYVSNFNRFGKLYRVMMQASPDARVNPETLSAIKVRNGSGMASLSNYVTLKRVYGPDLLTRFNMFQSISVTGQPNPGYSSGEAIAAINRVAEQALPQGYGFEFSGMTREEQNSSAGATAVIFGLCLLFVYLLLSAQYESYILPWAVILSIPFGLMGTFIFADIAGIDNNIYLQIALIMLIGLLAKNAILIVEFAVERRRTGMSIVNAAIDGASARLRPILMTSFAMIIGLLPMMFATGAGANGNRALGTGSVGGMLIGMILQLLIVPALFVVFQYLQELVKPLKWEDTDNQGIESEIEQYSR
ncbi:MAG: efflux RND transporter permease subunit [Bacteroides sp.]|nr:efflux RND transporter permease subunit [Barnesiella sp.]MBD5253698.1 efflux RND transporter permease subunit [Barnesiella sp.]MBD5344879.1 efflux RND transporter permease subunit [Bacteroides sp.]MBD5368626.1 efflux RND transporter permease subunit [Bacteroides sp.]